MKPVVNLRIVFFAFVLGACGSSRSAERDVLMSNATDCLVRETRAIAPEPIDLETATHTVLARCAYPGVIERSFAAEYPGYRDYIHEKMQKKYLEIVDSVRRSIASLRSQ